jgi:hypothetical protein
MTPQQIFDTVATHLFTQGQRAMVRDEDADDNTDFCAYRTSDGLKCAVGVLLPDELYVPVMENNSVYSLIRSFHVPSWFHDHQSLLMRLQEAHDRPASWWTTGDMRGYLGDVAREFSLDRSILDNLKFADR